MQETNLKDLEGIEDKFLISYGGSYLLTLEDAPTLIRRRATTAGGTQRRTSPSMKRSSAPLPGVRGSPGGRFPRGARMRRGSGTIGGNSGVEVVRGGMTTPTRVPASVAQGETHPFPKLFQIWC